MKVTGEKEFQAPRETVWEVLNDPAQMAKTMPGVEEREPEFAKLHAKGNGVGAVLNMDTSFNLTEEGGVTRMLWEADVHLLGPVASMGQRVLQPIVNQQVAQVLGTLDEQVQEAKPK
jgi:carbon monoxide dehydrogenase subunit G